MVGKEGADQLVDLWLQADDAYEVSRPQSMYWLFGVLGIAFWFDLVPNFEALSEEDRAYYEDFHLDTSTIVFAPISGGRSISNSARPDTRQMQTSDDQQLSSCHS